MWWANSRPAFSIRRKEGRPYSLMARLSNLRESSTERVSVFIGRRRRPQQMSEFLCRDIGVDHPKNPSENHQRIKRHEHLWILIDHFGECIFKRNRILHPGI